MYSLKLYSLISKDTWERLPWHFQWHLNTKNEVKKFTLEKQKKRIPNLSDKNSSWQLVLSLLTVVLTCCWWLLLSCLLGHFLKYVMWELCHPKIRLYKVSPWIVADYKQMRLFHMWLLQRHQNWLPQRQKI